MAIAAAAAGISSSFPSSAMATPRSYRVPSALPLANGGTMTVLPSCHLNRVLMQSWLMSRAISEVMNHDAYASTSTGPGRAAGSDWVLPNSA